MNQHYLDSRALALKAKVKLASDVVRRERGKLTTQGFHDRLQMIDDACEPGVAYMTRIRLLAEAVAGLEP